MYDNVEPYKCDPPGTFREVILHPGDNDRTIEKAIIMEHRFAFFFWMKWHNRLKKNNMLHQPAPTLVTIDWHRDLAPVQEDQKIALQELDQENLSDIANYIWAQFAQTNDGHILCAAWLNLVDDIILLQNTTQSQRSSFTDMNGNQHRIYEIREYDQFTELIQQREDKNILFDVDLDYFIHGKGNSQYSENFSRYSNKEIDQIMNFKNPVFQQMLPHIDGITIAQEPGYCGGITNSCHIMNRVHSNLFDDKGRWRHQTE